ncbi:MAG: SprT-like domain-containing protein [Acidobacteriota bacterium]
MPESDWQQLPEELRERARDWLAGWGLPELADEVRIESSTRMTRSLGRCYPGGGRVRLASWLFEDDAGLLPEVLCHELAHLAAAALHGMDVAPHGAEWRSLMAAAGFTPRARIPVADLPAAQRSRPRPRRRRHRYVYLHECPVCRVRRPCGRVVRAWRCRTCVEAGREGRLIVTRVVLPGPDSS